VLSASVANTNGRLTVMYQQLFHRKCFYNVFDWSAKFVLRRWKFLFQSCSNWRIIQEVVRNPVRHHVSWIFVFFFKWEHTVYLVWNLVTLYETLRLVGTHWRTRSR